MHISSLGTSDFLFLSRLFFSLIFLSLVPSCLLGLGFNCTWQDIFIISHLDDCNHLPAGLSAFLSPTAMPSSTLHRLQPGPAGHGPAPSRSFSLILTGFLASDVMLLSFAVLQKASKPFTCYSSCLVYLLYYTCFWITSTSSPRHSLGECHLSWKCFSDPLPEVHRLLSVLGFWKHLGAILLCWYLFSSLSLDVPFGSKDYVHVSLSLFPAPSTTLCIIINIASSFTYRISGRWQWAGILLGWIIASVFYPTPEFMSPEWRLTSGDGVNDISGGRSCSSVNCGESRMSHWMPFGDHGTAMSFVSYNGSALGVWPVG